MKRALITGGSGEIGQAICLRLAKEGYHIIVHANSNIEKADKIVAQIKQEGGSAQSVTFDITNAEQTANVIQRLIQEQPVQVLVHNAGIHADAPLAGMTKEQWNRIVDVSLNGFFNVSQPLLLSMIRTRWGRIIGMGSITGITGNRGQANYAAAKAGLVGACKSLSYEVASRGITVNVVAPGIIQTKMSEESFPEEKIKQLVPMKRAGRSDEVASLVRFLASDEADYISGQVISINGGMA